MKIKAFKMFDDVGKQLKVAGSCGSSCFESESR